MSRLVPRPHYCSWPMRFGSRGPRKFVVSDTSPKCFDRGCMGRRRTGTRLVRTLVSQQILSIWIVDIPSENCFFQTSSYPRAHVCVGVQCYPWLKFCSPLFAGVVMSLKQVRIFYIKPQHMHNLI